MGIIQEMANPEDLLALVRPYKFQLKQAVIKYGHSRKSKCILSWDIKQLSNSRISLLLKFDRSSHY